MIPPAILRLRWRSEGGRRRGIWLPLFILWPIVIPLFAMCLAVTTVAAIAMAPFGARRAWKMLIFLPMTWLLVSATRGLRVKVSDAPNEIEVEVW